MSRRLAETRGTRLWQFHIILPKQAGCLYSYSPLRPRSLLWPSCLACLGRHSGMVMALQTTQRRKKEDLARVSRDDRVRPSQIFEYVSMNDHASISIFLIFSAAPLARRRLAHAYTPAAAGTTIKSTTHGLSITHNTAATSFPCHVPPCRCPKNV